MNAPTTKENYANRGTHMFVWTSILTCTLFMIWAYFSQIEITSVATGEVIPSSKIKSVQHLEGGIVREIKVKEGDHVVSGQPLVTLESTRSGADVEELKVRVSSLQAQIARLTAEADGQDQPTFPKDLQTNYPDLIKQEKALFDAHASRFKNELKSQKTLVNQRHHETREIQVRLNNSRNNLKLLNEQVSISEGLVKEELTNRYDHLTLLRDKSKLVSSIEENKSALRRTQSAWNEAKSRLQSTSHVYHAEAREKLERARREHKEYFQRLLKYSDSLSRTVLRSPVDGVIKSLNVSTLSGVIKPGDTVVDIVPEGDRLIVEARLPPQDIGYVQKEQMVKIKLASADALRLGEIPGQVVNVSPDTFISDTGQAFYKVRVATERDYFERKGKKYTLYPGMRVNANILIGRKSIMESLLGPFLDSMGHAMQERL